ncbi:MAG: 4-hydroxy-3-methylbut-2-enyl diphosphate reductase, partial [Deltaproteobacteria bacterium]|nr:4-hydroxy-3-methylbut-2-enyl diphosphate reductase [Deltaproteobacteria bacterium]
IVANIEEAKRVEVPDPERVAVLTQTTLSVDDTREIIGILRQRFPGMVAPPKEDICYATQNRQDAVKELARHGIDPRWLEGVERVGITSGASVPERLVEEAADYFKRRGAEVANIGFVEENVHFTLPAEMSDVS